MSYTVARVDEVDKYPSFSKLSFYLFNHNLIITEIHSSIISLHCWHGNYTESVPHSVIMTEVPSSMKWTLYTLGLIGFYGTWIRSALNGALSILFRSLHVTGTLPGGQLPLKTSLTGIYWPLDYLLDMLIVFFWQAVDGSHPTTSLFSLYFAGQHIAVIVTMYVDSYKSNRSYSWKLR